MGGAYSCYNNLKYSPSFCLIFVLSLIDKSKKTTSKNSENQFLAMYWYINNIGERNLIVSLIISQKFYKTSVFIDS